MFDQTPHAHKLHKNHETQTNRILWQKVQIWLQVLMFVLVSGGVGWCWQEVDFVINTTTVMTGLALVAYFTTTISTVNNQCISIYLLQRDQALNELRLDIYQAVCEVLNLVLAKHLPGYRNLHSSLDVGEELLRCVTAISQRRASFQMLLTQKFPQLQMAQAIDAIIKESLCAHGLKGDVAEIETILSGFDDPNVVSITLRTTTTGD